MNIAIRPDIGASARIVQYNRLRYSNITINRPVLILVEGGTKILRRGDEEWIVPAGGCIALAQGEVFDVINASDGTGLYEARWIAFEPDTVAAFSNQPGKGAPFERAFIIHRPHQGFHHAFADCTQAIVEPGSIPDEIARHRLGELLLWLDLAGGRFAAPRPASFSARVRDLFSANPQADWASAHLCDTLGVSEATLRRKLAAEDWSFQTLLIDVRMSTAMQLLQSTDLSILRIAEAIGYESQSRFAARFRARFGFAPSAIRGHIRPGPEISASSSPSRQTGCPSP
ncbi:helix-turn-helix domain-containing protein [Shinella curvata]|uniref:Helix-turn-helix domain-containing protein n=1 Tax=Shinella curvata TaxID=1817964 RepID=A0ABT8XJ95_9HYPH|nr:helix-turn-helix domain-containing protein [Shinella curvata]MCJ8052710.1 helix-turn-helix domain-containing protein [Shinella curvata]MDO6123790.1 helix-turn-helix domain-containing protein [Shinella curvata]